MSRDGRGRVLAQEHRVASVSALSETFAWGVSDQVASYTAVRGGSAPVVSEVRAYAYDVRGRLVSEDFTPVSAPARSEAALYAFDGGVESGVGVRTSAVVQPGLWEHLVEAQSDLFQPQSELIHPTDRMYLEKCPILSHRFAFSVSLRHG